MALSEKTLRLLLSALGSPEARDEVVSDIENIQSSEIADGAITTAKLDALAVTNAKVSAGIDAIKLADGTVTNTELQFINSLSSNAQDQINAKLASASFTDAAVTGKLITGFVSGSGVVAATDSILDAVEKLDGNVAATVTVANAALPSASFTDAAVTSKLITGFVSGAGAVAATDTILESIEKLDGNVAGTVTVANAALPSASFTDAAVSGKLITGFVSGAGSVADTDTILQALNKLDGNVAGKQASGNYVTALTGDVTASGPGSVAASIASDVVTQAKLAPSVLKFSDITITSAQVLALNTTPKELLAAPGAGFCYAIDSIYATIDFNSAAYSASTDALEIRYTNGAGAKPAELSNTFLEAAADARELAQPASAIIPVENAAIVAVVPNADPTTGDSDIKVRVFYRVIPALL